MPVPATVDEFLDYVQKSGVADPAKLTSYVQKLRDANSLPAVPSKLAGLLVRDAVLTYFQAEQLLQGKWKRFSIGKYKVLERLGTGGMGQVFLCEHKLMRRRVAVKILPTAKAAEQSSLKRFYREARAIAALDHPNIVRAYDVDQDENLHFLVMEFVDGTNLQDLVKKFGPLDLLRACHYMYGSAVGLQYAFEMGILHRDIKPANILVDRTGVVKILDMGLARFFNDEDDHLTKKYDENVLGTADYLSPEQAVDSHAVDIRADIYSLGGTFYFLLTGLPPFPEGSVAQKLLWHQTREPKTVRDHRPDVPAEVAAIVTKMMAKEPNDRYTTPAELMAALVPWVQTPIPPPPERELPSFSPAAVGSGANRPAVSGILMTGSDRLVAGGATGTGTQPMPAAVAQGSTPSRPSIPVPPDAGRSGRPGESVNGLWETLASETRADAKSDTGSSVPNPRPPRRTTWPAAVLAIDDRRRARLVIAAAAGAMILLIAGAYGVYRWATAPDMPQLRLPRSVGTEPRTWVVSKAGPPADGAVAELVEALRRAGPGDTISIQDDRLEEPAIAIDSRSFRRLRDVTIEAGNAGRLVTWAPKKSGTEKAVLTVSGIEGFRFRGVMIDAGGQFDYGLTVNGLVPGLSVEDVSVRGPKVAGVKLNVSAKGGEGRDPVGPAELTRLRVEGKEPYDSGVYFAGDTRVANKFVRVADGLFTGPAKAGVRIEGSAEEVELLHNRVYNTDTGVLFGMLSPPADGQQPPPSVISVRIIENTFYSLRDAGIRGEFAPNPQHQVALARNYFAKTPALVRLVPENASFPGMKPETNARDADSKEGNVPIAAIEVPPTGLDANPASDGGFLRYGRSSPLNAVGPKGQAVGAPPQ
jgi:serine/threonine protein kinase